MEMERDVTGRVSEVPAYNYAMGLGEGGYGGDVEELAGVELDAGEKEEGCCGCVEGDEGEDVGGCECCFCVFWGDAYHGVFGIEVVKTDLGFY